MAKELKKYEMRSTRRPAVNPLLSTTVAIQRATRERNYCYVSFSDALVQAVGKKLPIGLSEKKPAILYVIEKADGWHVYAKYYDAETGRKLWSTPDTPGWLRFYKVRNRHAHH